MKVQKLFMVIIILVCFMIPMLSYSKIAYPAEWDTDEGAKKMCDRRYQAAAQRVICEAAFPDKLSQQRSCFIENTMAYQLIMDYLIDKHERGRDSNIDFCLRQSLDKYWLSASDTTTWIIVFLDVQQCMEEE